MYRLRVGISFDAFSRTVIFTLICQFLQGYKGCALGKAKQAAKTEMEKLDIGNMSVKDLVKEAAKM